MNNISNSTKSYFAMTLTCIFWGFSFISTKVALTCFTPLSLAFYRFLIASIILFIIIKFKEPNSKMEKKDCKLFILSGFIGIFLYFLFENTGLKYVSASLGSILLSTIPVLAMVLDSIVYKEPFTLKKILSVLISVIGVCFVVGINTSTSSFFSLKGIILMLLASLSWVLYNLFTKPLYEKYTILTITYYQTLFGTFFFLILLPFNPVDWHSVTIIPILHVLYLGVICSALSYLLYVYSLEKLGTTICTILINLLPVITIVASMFTLGEKITLTQVFGTFLIISSVFIITGRKKSKTLREF